MRRAIRRYIVHSFLGVITASFFLIIIRDKDISSNCPARIEALSVAFPALTFNPVRAVDRFSAIFSTSVKSLA
jgi:hypothetical protein